MFVLALLLIEFLDEFIFGASEAAWPLIRSDLSLSYVQIGLLLGVPGLVSSLVEPVMGILADVWRRRVLILGGGMVFGLALLLIALSPGFWLLLIAFILFYPASGAFVSLSQTALMDAYPDRHEQNMARWTFAGSVGVVAGPLALGAAALLGIGWRGLFLGFAALAVTLLAGVWRLPLDRTAPAVSDDPGSDPGPTDPPLTFKAGLINALRALRRRDVVRWLVVLQGGDLMLDVLYSFLALYFVDVVGISVQGAGLAVAIWTGVGLAGDLLIIPLLERVDGLVYLRRSAALLLVLFPAFLLVPAVAAKLVLLAALGLLNAGWYAIPKAHLYSSMPGQSGTALAVYNAGGLVGSLIPLALGIIAHQFDLRVSMWLLLVGPLVMLIGIPRRAADLL